jgi:hypothetical protein
VNVLHTILGEGNSLKRVSYPGPLGPVEVLDSRGVETPLVAIDDKHEARKLLIASKNIVSMYNISREECGLTARIQNFWSIEVVRDCLESVVIHP